ncbi:MAG TPA: response regulator transcription factor [Rickettsiales bacterium]|nr:response regulator transcription factor [Rickettsiales bacterium]
MRVLLIEDDKDAAGFIVKGLQEAGHHVEHMTDGSSGLFHAVENEFDVLIIDRMLPKLDGLTIIQTLRASGNTTPILILSALHQVDERVKGLKSGGDDYLVKPFAFAELMARIEVLMRRQRSGSEQSSLQVGDLVMNFLTRKVTRSGKDIPLQNREFMLLEYLMRHAGQVVTRTMLLESVWDFHFDPQTNVIDVQVSRLRQKIDKGFDKSLIKTIRGVGYQLSES